MRKANSDFQPLATQGEINKANLKQNQYTISLMNEGLRTRLLHPQEVYSIQSKMMLILKDLIRRYTQDESSSVAVETAEGFLTSILYSVDAQMKSYEQPDKAVAALQTIDLREIYEQGVERVRQCFEETKRLYAEVKKDKLEVDVDAYNLTIDESLPVFIKKYEIVFDAHNTMASIDYPLAIDDMRVQGVYYIRQYLERLLMETRFCRLFDNRELLDLLRSFGELCRFDYQIELFNLFELTFHQAIFSVLSGGAAHEVHLSAYQFEQLQRMLIHMDASRTTAAILEAIDRLERELHIEDTQLIQYMHQSGQHLVQRLIHAVDGDSLRAIIVTRREERTAPVNISFSLEDRMNDIELRQLLDEVSACENSEDKAQLIKSRLHSLHDYLDLFESGILYGDEYSALFKLFGNIELAILAKIVLYEELRSDMADLSTILSDQSRGGDMETWQTHYLAFMQDLDPERQKSIERLIEQIHYDEMNFH